MPKFSRFLLGNNRPALGAVILFTREKLLIAACLTKDMLFLANHDRFALVRIKRIVTNGTL